MGQPCGQAERSEYDAVGKLSALLSEANQRIAALERQLAEAAHDIEAYRDALGYPMRVDHDGKLTDGTTPENEIAADAARRLAEAQALNRFFRDSVGECHVMISRKTAEYQVKKEWETTDLPPRLQKILRERDALKALVELAQEWAKAYAALSSGRDPADSYRLELAYNATCERLYEALDAGKEAGG